jgi:hypothetical protein
MALAGVLIFLAVLMMLGCHVSGYQATILHHQDHAGVLAPYLTVHRAYGYINPNCINLGKIKASYAFLCGFPR